MRLYEGPDLRSAAVVSGASSVRPAVSDQLCQTSCSRISSSVHFKRCFRLLSMHCSAYQHF